MHLFMYVYARQQDQECIQSLVDILWTIWFIAMCWRLLFTQHATNADCTSPQCATSGIVGMVHRYR